MAAQMNKRTSSGDGEDDIEHVLGLSKNQKWKKAAWIVVGVLLAMGLAAAITFAATRPPDDGIEWREVELDRSDIVVRVSATGSLEPGRSVSVGAEVSGKVAEVLVDHNDKVTKGQVLVRFDLDTFTNSQKEATASLRAANAEIARANATFDSAEITAKQLEELAAKDFVSDNELVRGQTELDVAKATVSSAKAQRALAKIRVEQAEDQLAKAVITSPIDGTILSRNVEPGNTIVATMQAPELFVVAQDLGSMVLELDIDEADVGSLEVGQQATFTVDAWPSREFVATVTKVLFAPTTVGSVVTYTTELEVDNSDLVLRPGMTATAEIITRTREGVLRAPNTALRFTPPSDDAQAGVFGGPREPKKRATRTEIWVLDNGVPTKVEAKIGDTDGYYTEVESAELDEGTKVLVGYDQEDPKGGRG